MIEDGHEPVAREIAIRRGQAGFPAIAERLWMLRYAPPAE